MNLLFENLNVPKENELFYAMNEEKYNLYSRYNVNNNQNKEKKMEICESSF